MSPVTWGEMYLILVKISTVLEHGKQLIPGYAVLVLLANSKEQENGMSRGVLGEEDIR